MQRTSHSQLGGVRCTENAIKTAYIHSFCGRWHACKYPINTWKSSHKTTSQTQTHTTCKLFSFVAQVNNETLH